MNSENSRQSSPSSGSYVINKKDRQTYRTDRNIDTVRDFYFSKLQTSIKLGINLMQSEVQMATEMEIWKTRYVCMYYKVNTFFEL